MRILKIVSKQLKDLPRWVLILNVAFIISIATLLFLVLQNRNNKNTDSSPTSANSDLTVANNPNPNQDTLAEWKADPSYHNPITGLGYAELFRNSDKYVGKFVHYRGEVIQVLGDPGNWNLRVNVTKKGDDPYAYWQDTVLIYSYSSERVIEDDIIDFTAKSDGVTTYKSVLGGDITIPAMTIYEQAIIGRAQ